MEMVTNISLLLFFVYFTRIECLTQGKSYLIKVSDKESNDIQKSENVDNFYSIEDDNQLQNLLNGTFLLFMYELFKILPF